MTKLGKSIKDDFRYPIKESLWGVFSDLVKDATSVSIEISRWDEIYDLIYIPFRNLCRGQLIGPLTESLEEDND